MKASELEAGLDEAATADDDAGVDVVAGVAGDDEAATTDDAGGVDVPLPELEDTDGVTAAA